MPLPIDQFVNDHWNEVTAFHFACAFASKVVEELREFPTSTLAASRRQQFLRMVEVQIDERLEAVDWNPE